MPRSKKPNEAKVSFLIEAYKLRAQLYGDLTNRMWSRFNYLLTANIAAVSIFFGIWIDVKSFTGTIWFPIMGIIISIVWFILGAQDRYYFEGFRTQVKEVEETITAELEITDLKDREFGTVGRVKTDFLTWRWKFGSLSRLPALVPLLFALIWGLILIIVLVTKDAQLVLSSVQHFHYT